MFSKTQIRTPQITHFNSKKLKRSWSTIHARQNFVCKTSLIKNQIYFFQPSQRRKQDSRPPKFPVQIRLGKESCLSFSSLNKGGSNMTEISKKIGELLSEGVIIRKQYRRPSPMTFAWFPTVIWTKLRYVLYCQLQQSLMSNKTM